MTEFVVVVSAIGVAVIVIPLVWWAVVDHRRKSRPRRRTGD
jgi:hypothetical protein